MPPAEHQQENSVPSRRSSGQGSIVGIIVIVLLVLFGGFYFWGAHLNAEQNTNASTQGDAA